VLVEPEERERERAHLAALCEQFDAAPPARGASHYSAPFGAFRLKWERHGEFSAYTVFVHGRSPLPFGEPAVDLVPGEWLAAIPGRTIVAAHAELMPAANEPLDAEALAGHFEANVVAGAEIGEGAGLAYTDFLIHSDGCVRFLVLDRGFTRRLAGRMLQRLFEVETYRVMALLSLPIARREAPQVVRIERALVALTGRMARQSGADEALLGELTGLAAEVESALASSQYRFGASRAFVPGSASCASAAFRASRRSRSSWGAASPRPWRPASRSRDGYPISPSASPERAGCSPRAWTSRGRGRTSSCSPPWTAVRGCSWRLQETVEGLSIAAVTYYLVGLIGYAAKALKAGGFGVDPDLAIGLAIPGVAIVVALGVRRVRRRIVGAERA